MLAFKKLIVCAYAVVLSLSPFLPACLDDSHAANTLSSQVSIMPLAYDYPGEEGDR